MSMLSHFCSFSMLFLPIGLPCREAVGQLAERNGDVLNMLQKYKVAQLPVASVRCWKWGNVSCVTEVDAVESEIGESLQETAFCGTIDCAPDKLCEPYSEEVTIWNLDTLVRLLQFFCATISFHSSYAPSYAEERHVQNAGPATEFLINIVWSSHNQNLHLMTVQEAATEIHSLALFILFQTFVNVIISFFGLGDGHGKMDVTLHDRTPRRLERSHESSGGRKALLADRIASKAMELWQVMKLRGAPVSIVFPGCPCCKQLQRILHSIQIFYKIYFAFVFFNLWVYDLWSFALVFQICFHLHYLRTATDRFRCRSWAFNTESLVSQSTA